jgi:hypothetical protein
VSSPGGALRLKKFVGAEDVIRIARVEEVITDVKTNKTRWEVIG